MTTLIKNLCLVLICAAISADGLACLNGETRELSDGTVLYEDHEGTIVPYGHEFFEDEFPALLLQLDSLWRVTKRVDYRSDYALILILSKKYQEAISIYLEIERNFPNRYSTASNLGTAYELIGDNVNALKWIKRAVEIDPWSHYESEWIHVNILEAKIKGPEFINAEFLIRTSFGEGAEPVTNISQGEMFALMRAIYYQLNERISFVKTPDPVVACLLYQQASLAYMSGEMADALHLMKKASAYGMVGEEFDRRHAFFVQVKKSKAGTINLKRPGTNSSSADMTLLYTLLGGTLVVFAAMVAWQMRSN